MTKERELLEEAAKCLRQGDELDRRGMARIIEEFLAASAPDERTVS